MGRKFSAWLLKSILRGSASPKSRYMNKTGIEQYQSLLGSLQWAISLGKIDIATAVMSMPSFLVVPRRGHLQHLHCIYGCLFKLKNAAIRYRTHALEYSDLPA